MSDGNGDRWATHPTLATAFSELPKEIQTLNPAMQSWRYDHQQNVDQKIEKIGSVSGSC